MPDVTTDLTDAVGFVGATPCPNRPADVMLVKRLLNPFASRIGLTPPLDVTNPTCGPKTLKAIEDFQRVVMRKGPPFGRVLPARQGGTTLRALLAGPGAAPPPAAPAGDAPWMAFARDEVGQHEVAGRGNNPRIIAYHATTSLRATSDSTAWCASFVNWCIVQAGLRGKNSARAADWLAWGVSTQAREGAVIVIRNGAAANSSLTVSGNHVGFLVEETATLYRVLGGNQSDQVKVSNFPKSKWALRGYRWPA